MGLKNQAMEEWQRQNQTKKIDGGSSLVDTIDFFTPLVMHICHLQWIGRCTKHNTPTIKPLKKTTLAFPVVQQKDSSIQQVVSDLVNYSFLRSTNDTGGQLLPLP